MSSYDYPLKGRCVCGELVYHMKGPPMATHCCHCRWCQRQTGSAFATHALIELILLEIVSGEVETVTVDTPTGSGQIMTRCSKCHFAIWSAYRSLGPEADVLRSLDVGTLDEPDSCPPDYHIYTRHKQQWIKFSGEIPVFDQLYDENEIWPKEKLQRRRKALDARGAIVLDLKTESH